MAVQFSNNAATNLSAAISASATSITVADASEFPTLSGSDYTYVTLSNLLETVVEVVKVTAISGNTLTVVRGQDNTTASAFASGNKCELRVTAALLNDVAEQADTNTEYTAGSGITLTGTTFSNAAPDQTVSLTGSGDTSVSGTYPNFTVSSTDTNTTYSVGDGGLTQNNFTNALKSKLDGIESSADVTDTANVVGALTAGTNVTIASDGTISSTDTNTTYTAGTNLSLSGTTFNLNTNLSGLGTISSGAITSSGRGTFDELTLTGGSDNLTFNEASGDWTINNAQQNNGIKISDGTGGVAVNYNGAAVAQFDGSGGMNLISGSLRVGGTAVIDSSRNLANLGTISASGQVTADRFLSGIGSVASPAYKVGDADSGFYDSGDNMIGVALGGVQEYDFQPTKLDMKGNQLDNVGNLQVDVTSSNGVRVTGTDSVADAAFTTMLIDHNASGSTALTADRSHIGLAIDMDSSATGGDTANEHRLFGIHSHVKSTGDSDLIHGIYASAEAEQTAGQVSALYGGYFQALGDVTGGTLTNSYGVYGYNSVASASGTTITNNYALYGKTLVGATQDSNVNQAVGVYGEVEIDVSGASTTLSSAHVFQAQFDNDSAGDVTINTGYLYYGNYAGTLPSTAYGVYIADAVRNYFGGTLTSGLGSTTAAAYGFNGDLNTGMYSPVNHEVALLANGTNRLNINASGAQVTGSVTASGALQIGGTTVIDSSREGSFATRAQFGGIDSAGNVEPPSNNTIVSGYGLIGNRGTMYITNGGGAIQLGNGGIHNGDSGLSVETTVVDVGSGRSLAMNGTTVIDSSRNLTNVGTLNGGTPYTTANDTLLMHKGADIPGSVDLNNYTANGFYHQNSNSNATSGSNYPASAAGMLTVTADGAMVYQTYHQYNGNNYYFRSYYNGTWYGWRKLYHSGTGDLTVSGLVTADRFYSGLGTAASPAFQVGDTNTGFFDSGANTIGVACNGSHEFNFTTATLDMKGNTITNGGNITLYSSAGDERYLHLPRGGGITLYGDGSSHHGIFSRNSGNSPTDDILISSYGAVYFDLDSNSNNSSAANFEITKHNGTAAIFKVDGETSDITTLGDIYIPSKILHTGDTDTYTQFHAANQWRVVTGGTERLEVNQGTATVAGTLNVRVAIDLADSDFLRLGSGDDVEFFCNGSHMYMDLNSGIGNFYIRDGTTIRYTFNDNGSFTATGNVTAYSDRRVKAQFEPITDALAKVQQLHGQTYIRTDMDDANRRYAGLIAQDVEAVLPEAVSEVEDHLALDYSGTIGLLVEAIKELKQEVNDLKAQLEDK